MEIYKRYERTFIIYNNILWDKKTTFLAIMIKKGVNEFYIVYLPNFMNILFWLKLTKSN